MYKRNLLLPAAMLTVAGCVAANGGRYEIGNVPPEVADRAAPGQDLSTTRLLAEDNCYWYMHNGPVESTLVPLRTRGGLPICLKSPS